MPNSQVTTVDEVGSLEPLLIDWLATSVGWIWEIWARFTVRMLYGLDSKTGPPIS
jgi:hypothetical protein